MNLTTRNNSKRWTANQDDIAQYIWMSLKMRSYVLGRSEGAIINRIYKLSRKVEVVENKCPKDYVVEKTNEQE